MTRNRLAAEIIIQMFKVMGELQDRSFLKEYREHSILLGKKILVYAGSEPEDATALDVDGNGGLVVELSDGTKRVLSTGEVTVRVAGNEKNICR